MVLVLVPPDEQGFNGARIPRSATAKRRDDGQDPEHYVIQPETRPDLLLPQ